MLVKAIKDFYDKTTGKTYHEQKAINIGDIFECDDELAKERIEKGFVVEVKEPKDKTKKENKKGKEKLDEENND